MTELSIMIKKLRESGKSYSAIAKEVGCSKSTVCHNLDPSQKEKSIIRQKKRRLNIHPLQKKIEIFNSKYKNKTRQKTSQTSRKRIYVKLVNFNGRSTINMITIQQLFEKFGENPKCYLTGIPINLNNPSEYELDHKIPKSRGGDNSLDNLGLTHKLVNRAKSDMTPDEFINLCKLVAKNN